MKWNEFELLHRTVVTCINWMTLASYQLILEVAFFECYVITHAFIGFYGDFRGNRLNIGLVTVILQFLSKLRNFVPFSFFTNFLRILHMIFSLKPSPTPDHIFSLTNGHNFSWRTVTISLDERSQFSIYSQCNFFEKKPPSILLFEHFTKTMESSTSKHETSKSTN